MLNSTRFIKYLYLTIISICFVITGCFATKNDVKDAVDQSNKAIAAQIAFNTAALIPDSGITLEANPDNNTWQDSIEQIDLIIANNPDQEILINHLRVRQAMVLTIYRQGNFAKEKWQSVEPTELKTERDIKLFENSDTLVWWYRRAANKNTLSQAEINRAIDSISALDSSINTTENHDLKIYLAAIRAQIALRVLRDSLEVGRLELIEEQISLVADLEEFVNTYDNEEQIWLQNNPDLKSAKSLTAFELRNIFWLRAIISNYFSYEKCLQQTASRREIDIPQTVWKPSWLNNISNTETCQ